MAMLSVCSLPLDVCWLRSHAAYQSHPESAGWRARRVRRWQPVAVYSVMVPPRRLDDTSIDARRVHQELYASMTPGQKLRCMSELTLAVNRFALAGLAARYPDESRPELLLRLARLRLGDELVDRVYE